jgi:hypothetical protein
MAKHITADEFEAQYAERSRMSIADLRASGRVVAPCDCDYKGCEDWQSMSRDLMLEEEGVYRRPSKAEVMGATAAAFRASMDFEASMKQIKALAS